MATAFKSPIVAQLETISLPDGEYKPPVYPFEPFDESLFKLAPFGHEIKRANFSLEDNIHFLNHGSFGATPKVVANSQRKFQDLMEAQPVRFFNMHFRPMMIDALRNLAPLVNAPAENLVFVDNATSGVLAAVQSIDWKAGDSLLYLDIGYGPIIKFLKLFSARLGFKLIEVKAPVPVNLDKLAESIEKSLHQDGTRTRLAIIDHITSGTGLVLPIKKFISICHSKQVPVCVDGAHAIGQVKVDLSDLNPDFYVSNLHKWLFASKGCAFFYVAKQHWGTIHPTMGTEGTGMGLQAEFSWTGTKDYTPWLSTLAAIEFYKRAGDEKIREHNHKLAVWAGKMLQESWKTSFAIDSTDLAQHVGSLVTIRVPVNKQFSKEEIPSHVLWLHDTLWDKYKIEIPVMDLGGVVHLRISAQIYNIEADYLALRDAIKEIYQL